MADSSVETKLEPRLRLWRNWTFFGTPRYDAYPVRDHKYECPRKTASFNNAQLFISSRSSDPADLDEVLQLASQLVEQGMASTDGRKAIIDDALLLRLAKALDTKVDLSK